METTALEKLQQNIQTVFLSKTTRIFQGEVLHK